MLLQSERSEVKASLPRRVRGQRDRAGHAFAARDRSVGLQAWNGGGRAALPVVRSHEHNDERMRAGAGANRIRALHRFASDATSCSGAVSTPIRTRVVAAVALRFAVARPLVDRPSLCSGPRPRPSLPLPRTSRQSAARRRIRTREKSGDIRRLRVEQLLERTYVDSTDQPTAGAQERVDVIQHFNNDFRLVRRDLNVAAARLAEICLLRAAHGVRAHVELRRNHCWGHVKLECSLHHLSEGTMPVRYFATLAVVLAACAPAQAPARNTPASAGLTSARSRLVSSAGSIKLGMSTY